MKIKYRLALLLLIAISSSAEASRHNDRCLSEKRDFSDVLPCYTRSISESPPKYTRVSDEQVAGVDILHYRMNSQSWSPAGLVQPEEWQHDVDIYIPPRAKRGKAVIFVNNGTNNNIDNKPPVAPSDMTPPQLTALAQATRTIILSLSDVPNQYQTWRDDNKTRAEDNSVAHSWSLFMQNPTERSLLPLHIPMAASVSQAMSLAERELREWRIKEFIVTGLSKRGWSSWLAAIADPRVEAIAPFVMDMLGTRQALKHMYRVYGHNWPVAFSPYYQEGIDTSIDMPNFSKLLKIQDPLEYQSSAYKKRLAVKKYIINASGDDFYVPDNSRYYYDQLPGMKSLRVVPNSDHAGIRRFAESSLIPFINRIQSGKPLPKIHTSLKKGLLDIKLSEYPKQLTLWRAYNANDRDFRLACGVNYESSTLPVKSRITLTLVKPHKGWQAAYVEAIFRDGYVATTEVYITPDESYPDAAPLNKGGACQTLPGRGLSNAHQQADVNKTETRSF